MHKKQLYIAYGSNINLERWHIGVRIQRLWEHRK